MDEDTFLSSWFSSAERKKNAVHENTEVLSIHRCFGDSLCMDSLVTPGMGVSAMPRGFVPSLFVFKEIL